VLAGDLNVELPDDVLHTLADACGGHPQLSWLVMDRVSALRSRFAGMLDPDNTALALEQVRQSTPFRTLVTNLLADFASPERAVLSALATHGGPGQAVTADAIRQAWQAEGLALDPEAALDSLARTTLVVHAPPDGYQLRIGLIRDWLTRRDP